MDLKQLEKKTWETMFIDGITDIGIGLLIAISTVLRFSEDIDIFDCLWMIAPAPFMFLAKRYITDPRMGQVKFSKERIRKDHRHVMSLGVIIAAIFAIVIFLIKTRQDIIQAIPYPWVIIGTGLFIIWSAIAYLRDFPRLYLYAFLMSVSVVLTNSNTQDNPAGIFAWSATSAIMVAIGIYLFVKFMKKYPLPQGESQ